MSLDTSRRSTGSDVHNTSSISAVVADHYNRLEEKGREAREGSRIIHMRSFNNWIKSMLISEALEQVRASNGHNCRVTVLDIGIGKGGDLLKYKIGRITHLIGTDIAETSIEQCNERYQSMKVNPRTGFRNHNLFTAEFKAADSTRDLLKDKVFRNPNIHLDLVSIQFVFHYCFESLPQAEMMLRNISSNLSIGGFWIGTTPNSYEIVKRARQANSRHFGNDVYSITFDDDTVLKKEDEDDEEADSRIPLFGCKYNFHLDDVVDCPEFLVYYPALVKMAFKYGLRPVFWRTFEDYFEEKKETREGRQLLERMRVFSEYPPPNDPLRTAIDIKEYPTAEEHFLKHHRTLGTISKSEWEVITLYNVFAFQKFRPISGEEDLIKQPEVVSHREDRRNLPAEVAHRDKRQRRD